MISLLSSKKILTLLFNLLFISVVFPQDRHKQLISLYRNGLYDSTINELNKIKQPNNPDLWILKGKSYRWLYYHDSSIFYFKKALNFHKISKKQKAESLLGLSVANYYKNNLVNSLEQIKEAEELIKHLPDNKLIPYILFYKIILDNSRNLEGKHHDIRKALSLFSNENPDIISFYIHYIDILLDEFEVEIADKYFATLEELIIKFPNHKPKIAHFYNLKGYYLHLKGDYRKSIDIFENKLLPFIANEKSHWAISEKMNYLRMSSIVQFKLHNFNKIIKNYKEFINLSNAFYGQDSHRLIGIYGSLSWLYNYLGNSELSTNYKLLSLNRGENQQSNFSKTLNNFKKGEFYFSQNKKGKAIKHYELVINQKTISNQIASLQINSYFKLAKVYNDSYQSKKALDSFEKGILITKEYPLFKKLSIPDQFLHCQLLLANKNSFEAHRIYKKILSNINFNKSQHDLDEIQFINEFSNQLIMNGFYDSSQVLLDKILPANLEISKIKSRYNVKNALVNTLLNKGLLHFKKFHIDENIKNLNQAYFHYKQSIELIELNRKSYKSASDRISQLDNENFVFESIIGTAYKLFDLSKNKKYLNDIHYYIESSKSNQLLESLNRNHAIKKSEIPDSILLNINNLKQQASYLESQITRLEKNANTVTDSIQLNLFKTTLVENKVNYQELILNLEKEYPNYYQLNYNQQIADLTKTQANLKPNEALIEYLSGDSSLFVFTITQKEVNLKRLEKPNEELIKRFQETVQPEAFGNSANRLFKQFTLESHELYQDLLGHSLTWLKENSGNESISKLYIIPDKSLNYLPFDLLIQNNPKEGDSNDFGSLDYLIKDYTVSYGYSATILFRENLVKDRTYHSSLLAVAPSYGSLLNDSSELSKLGKFRDDFSELLFNKQEVDNIGQYFDGTILKNEEATEKAFLENLPNHDIVHLAMHAMVDNEKPTNSRLIFSPDKDTVHDNYLHNFELYNMNIPTRLAVLSACNTGYGNLRSGEGVISLARAFTYAGAESVVMSHWRVDDQSSSIIMKGFYKYLADGQDKDKALRLAKLEYLANASPLKQHPFYWNNFVIVGDVSPFDVQSKWYQAWYVYLMGILLIGLAFGIVFKKR